MSVAAISHGRTETGDNVWTGRLVLFLRVMAVVSVAKGATASGASDAPWTT